MCEYFQGAVSDPACMSDGYFEIYCVVVRLYFYGILHRSGQEAFVAGCNGSAISYTRES